MTDPEKTLQLCVSAAERLAAELPTSETVTVAGAQAGSEHVVAPFAAAVLAETDHGRLGLLVAEELLEAVEAAENAGIDLAGVVRPALDAVAEHLDVEIAEVRPTELELLVGDMGGDFLVVPLIGDGFVAALAVPRPVLDGALRRRGAPRSGTGAASADAEGPEGPEGFHGTTPSAADRPEDPAPVVPADVASGRAEPPLSRPVYHQGAPVPPAQRRGIELLHGVDMEVTVELGRTRLAVKDLLALSPGAVVELDRAAGAPADLLVNGKLIARGEVVVVDEDFGLRITEIVETAAAV